MRAMTTTTLFLAVTLILGCGKKDEGNGEAAAKGEGGGGAAKKGPAPLEWKKIPNMGLQIEVPADAEMFDMSADAPNVKFGGNTCNVYVSTVTLAYADSFDAAKREVEKDPNTFKKFTKEEQIEGGWHLEYELESMMDKSPLYGVKVRATIDGKQYECGDNSRSAEGRDCATKACRGLKKL